MISRFVYPYSAASRQVKPIEDSKVESQVPLEPTLGHGGDDGNNGASPEQPAEPVEGGDVPVTQPKLKNSSWWCSLGRIKFQ